MEKERVMQIIKGNCFEKFNDFSEMYEFIKDMNSEDRWETVSMTGTKIKEVEPESSLMRGNFFTCEEEDLQQVEKNGGFILSTKRESYILSTLSFNSMRQRLGINCKAATRMIEQGENKKFANFSNLALSVSKDEENTVLIRGGKIIAMHSKGYDSLDQSQIIDRIEKHLKTTFEDHEFIKGSYSHELTQMTWTLGGKDSEITKAYVDAWEKAGFNSSDLNGIKPVVDFATNDIGTQSVAFYPAMVLGRNRYCIGAPIKIKHYGGKSYEDIDKSLDMLFAEMKDGAEQLGRMLTIDIEYPIETFIRAAKAVGLNKICLKILKDVLEGEKISYGFDSESTAFMLYDSLAGIPAHPKYDMVSDFNKIRIRECIARLLTLDWKELDGPGLRDFN